MKINTDIICNFPVYHFWFRTSCSQREKSNSTGPNTMYCLYGEHKLCLQPHTHVVLLTTRLQYLTFLLLYSICPLRLHMHAASVVDNVCVNPCLHFNFNSDIVEHTVLQYNINNEMRKRWMQRMRHCHVAPMEPLQHLTCPTHKKIWVEKHPRN